MESNTVMEIATLIAAALGNGWRAEPGYRTDDSDARLRGPDDEDVHLSQAWEYSRRDRLVLSGSLTGELHTRIHDNVYPYPRHEITVSRSKSAERIARDIQRRLLPGYRATLATARRIQQRHQERTAARDALASELIAALGDVAHRTYSGDIGIDDYGRPFGGKVKLSLGEGCAIFTVRVPQTEAVAFATRINAFRQSWSLSTNTTTATAQEDHQP